MFQYFAKNGLEPTVFFVGRLYEPDYAAIAQRGLAGRVLTVEGSAARLPLRRRLLAAAKGLVPLALKREIKRALGMSVAADTVGLGGHGERGLEDFISVDAKRLFDDLNRERAPAFVLIQTVRLTKLIEGWRAGPQPRPHILVDTHDVMHRRSQSFKQRGETAEFRISRAEEADALAHYDTIIAIQDREAEVLRELAPQSRVITAAHPQVVNATLRAPQAVTVLLFTGSQNRPNIHALQDFATSVWPELRAHHGAAVELHVAGRVCEHVGQFAEQDGVRLLGVLDELESVFHEADIFVNPVHFGSGLKIKTVEALSHGFPLVTTTVGAEGLEPGIGQAFLVADTGPETVEALSRLIDTPAERQALSRAAIAFATQNFAEDQVYNDLGAILFGGD